MSRPYRQGAHFQRPENALKRAEELQNVGQRAAALQALHDVLNSKKHRTWTKSLENLIYTFITLCIEERKGRYAKDGLSQYRNVCQNVNINSLEEVIKFYLKKTTDKADEAQAKAQAVALDSEDLEVEGTPEDLMLSYVSGEKSKDRMDRELVMPWFRFLWETYRSILDILRNNAKLENLYAMTAKSAFQFCLKYKRNSEFRRLCDILRNHFSNLQKHRDQRDRPDLSKQETLNLYLDTRFEQLRVACELEMWQEAFRSVEDIQGLAVFGKKSPRPQTRATYFTRLTQIFDRSDSPLYLSYAWWQLYSITVKHNKMIEESDKSQMAGAVVLSALSVLPYARPKDVPAGATDTEKDHASKMTSILSFVDGSKSNLEHLSRAELLKEVSSKNLLSVAPEVVRNIFSLLESDFAPLELCHKMAPLLEEVKLALGQPVSAACPVPAITADGFVPKLQRIAVLRMLQQLSQVYSVMRMSQLQKLVPFLNSTEVEAVVMDAVKYNFLHVRLDHRLGSMHFGMQQLESASMRSQLTELARRLNIAMAMIEPGHTITGRAATKADIVNKALSSMREENLTILARKTLIERRKEAQERELHEKEKEEEERRIRQAMEQKKKEEERRQQEMRRREADRLQKELEEEDAREMELLAKQAKLDIKSMAKDGEKLDKMQMVRAALQEKKKEEIEFERKLARQTRLMDHLERAKREEEVPYLQEFISKFAEEDEAQYKRQQAEKAELHRKAWEVDLQRKQVLMKMVQDSILFRQQLVDRREDEFQRLRAAQLERLRERQDLAALHQEKRRKEAFVQRCREILQEKLRRMEEEKRREEEEARQRKLDEQAERQRQRQAEIDARMSREVPSAPPPRRDAPPPSSGGSMPRRSGYVPPHLRRKEAAGDADAPPQQQQHPQPEPEPQPQPQPQPREGSDSWSRAREEPPPPSRDRYVPRSTRATPSARPPPDAAQEAGTPGGAAADAPPPRPSGGSRYVPPSRRTRDSGPSNDGGGRRGGGGW